MRFLFLVTMMLFITPAFAGVQGLNSSGTNLGVFNKIKCGSGVTCTKVGDYMNMAASAVTASVAGAEGVDAILTLSADESDDSGDDWALKSVAATNSFTISNDTTGSLVAKMTITTTGDVTGPGTGALSGYLQKQVAATATTITAAQCGSTFYNSGAVQMELPAGTAGLVGCRLTFVTMNAANFDLNPATADQIILLTDAAGDAIRNATIGNVVILQYVATNKWIDMGHIGTWSDIN